MTRRGWQEPKGSEITPESLYLRRRALMKGGLAAAAAALVPSRALAKAEPTGDKLAFSASRFGTDEDRTPWKDVTSYNNFYEFGLGKSDPKENAHTLKTRPWTVEVGGLCEKPKTFGIEELLRLELEERVYRLRCVEAWSMVIPWIGFPLASLLRKVAPTSAAKYVAFQTLHDPKQLPHQEYPVLEWPYVEGLRLDEAMHPLTIMAAGLYGRVLPNQNGAPLRLVVPWKYGFKSIKSVVKITLVDKEPPTTWNRSAPREYGFYANVNPKVDHPRWSQAKERRIGDFFKRPTLLFNGYAEQVASLYAGLDLRKHY